MIVMTQEHKMGTDEFYTFEDQAYINPKLSSGEQMAFIDKFRDIQNQNNQQIATDTYNLGKALPSNLGGLGGGESYFNARYQNNQVDDMVANLKTAAQAQELNDVMSNYQAQLKKRYSNAQRAYNRRHAGSGSGNSLLDALKQLFGDPNKATGNVEEENVSGSTGILGQRLRVSQDDAARTGRSQSTVAGGAGNRYYYTYDDATGLVVGTNDPSYKSYGGVYIPSYVYDRMAGASNIPLVGDLGAQAILQQYIKNR